jgi:hypothetical protein
MVKLLIAAYLGGWLASAAPFYSTTKAANENQPIRNALKALGLSAAWLLTVIPIGITFIKDMITRFKPTATTTTTTK